MSLLVTEPFEAAVEVVRLPRLDAERVAFWLGRSAGNGIENTAWVLRLTEGLERFGHR